DTEKLPFAGYSVVKDQPGDYVPPDPLTRSLAQRFDASLRARGALALARAKNTRRAAPLELPHWLARGDPPIPHPPRPARLLSLARSARHLATDLKFSDAHSRRAFVAPLCSRQTLSVRLRLSPLACQPERRRQPRLAKAGGEYRARTGDLLVANQALSQL